MLTTSLSMASKSILFSSQCKKKNGEIRSEGEEITIWIEKLSINAIPLLDFLPPAPFSYGVSPRGYDGGGGERRRGETPTKWKKKGGGGHGLAGSQSSIAGRSASLWCTDSWRQSLDVAMMVVDLLFFLVVVPVLFYICL